MEGKKLRTAAYCRVSTTSDTQDGSFEVQCEYYEKLISFTGRSSVASAVSP